MVFSRAFGGGGEEGHTEGNRDRPNSWKGLRGVARPLGMAFGRAFDSFRERTPPASLGEEGDGLFSASTKVMTRTTSLSASMLSKATTDIADRDTTSAIETALREKLLAAERRLADLEDFYTLCATQPSGVLDKKLIVYGPQMAMQGVSGASAFWTSTPIASMMAKGFGGFFMLIYVIFVAHFAHQSGKIALEGGLVDYKNYRFRALETRSGGIPSSHGIDQIGLLRHGSMAALKRAKISSGSAAMTISFDAWEESCGVHGGRVQVISVSGSDGWYFKTSKNGDPSSDPVKFVFEGSNDGSSWEFIGASSWVRGADGRPGRSARGQGYPTPTERGQLVAFDMRPHWSWIATHVFVPCLDSAGLLVAAVISRTNANDSKKLFAKIMVVCAAVEFVCTAGSLASALHSLPLPPTYAALAFARIALASSAMLERLELALVGDCFLISHVAYTSYYAPEDDTQFVKCIVGVWAVAVLCLLLSHKKALWKSKQLVEPDRIIYDKVWNEICEDASEVDALERIKVLVCATEKSSTAPGQYSRKRQPRQRKACMWTRALCSVPKTTTISEEERKPRLSTESMASFPGFDDAREADVLITRTESSSSSHSLLRQGSSATSTTIEPSPSASNLWNAIGVPRKLISWGSGQSIDRSLTKIMADGPYVMPTAFGESESTKPANSVMPHLIGDLSNTLDKRRPIRSLDQLFTQAVGMDSVLRSKVKAYAMESKGMLPVVVKDSACSGGSRSVLMHWEHIVTDENLSKDVKWAKIKNSKRAIEKLLRSYKGDISRLTDVCRQSIIFDRADHILACLQAMVDDEEVVIERIKNRLTFDYDTRISAGYRDVAVNLRVASEETAKMGIETHVCEVQLILRRFYELKSDEGHNRYVQFRNFRGE